MGPEAIEVIEAAATKPYGFMPFFPGARRRRAPHSCDPHHLLWQLRERRVASPLIDTATTAIATRPHQARRACEVPPTLGRRCASRSLIVGVAYKPAVADVRESLPVEILAGLRTAGARWRTRIHWCPN
ncbi:hypothetical protein [Streptomyces sp. KL116D]|uniref:hypothetical protein n=1 Tax=Streptomyces sp. KL116D TaxID=3045152 RepID=UPI003556CA7D